MIKHYPFLTKGSAESIDIVNLTDKTIVEFLWNLGHNYKISSRKDLQEAISFFCKEEGVFVELNKVPFSIFWEMNIKGLFAGILIEKSFKTIGTSKLYSEELLAQYSVYPKLLMQIQKNNPNIDFSEYFSMVCSRQGGYSKKNKRNELLRAYIYLRDVSSIVEDEKQIKKVLNKHYFDYNIRNAFHRGYNKNFFCDVGNFKKMMVIQTKFFNFDLREEFENIVELFSSRRLLGGHELKVPKNSLNIKNPIKEYPVDDFFKIFLSARKGVSDASLVSEIRVLANLNRSKKMNVPNFLNFLLKNEHKIPKIRAIKIFFDYLFFEFNAGEEKTLTGDYIIYIKDNKINLSRGRN